MYNSNEIFKQLDEASRKWSEWEETTILVEETKKAIYAKRFLDFKENCTIEEAKNKAYVSEEYQEAVKNYAKTEKQRLLAKLRYNNLDKLSIMRMQENKIDLALTTRQS